MVAYKQTDRLYAAKSVQCALLLKDIFQRSVWDDLYSDSAGTAKKCHCKRVSLNPMIFSVRIFFLGTKNCHCSRSVTLTGVTVSGRACITYTGTLLHRKSCEKDILLWPNVAQCNARDSPNLSYGLKSPRLNMLNLQPYWRPDARGILCGMTQFTSREHVCRAALESIAFQTR